MTGADGFVGRWLVRAALQEQWDVTAVLGPGGTPPGDWLPAADALRVRSFPAELTSPDDLGRIASAGGDAIIHLAALASSAAARKDPDAAMAVNATATAALIEACGRAGAHGRFLFVSSGEVYGPKHAGPIVEDSPLDPVSPYAASKAAAEPAVLERGAASGLQPIIARPFTHTGPGQAPTYVLPALASRLRAARESGTRTVVTGNLAPVRDFLDVRDVVRAYLLLVERGVPGEVYNVASGVGRRLADCFDALARIIGVDAVAEPDAALLRSGDIPVLIGDASRLRRATGWTPSITFEQTLQDLVDAQAH